MRNTLRLVLKQLRQKSGKTQKQIAQELNITDRTYGHYETGKREPSIDTLIDIADYYQISLDILTGRYEARNTRNTIQIKQKPVGIQVARTKDGTSHKRKVTAEEIKAVEALPDATDF